MKLSSFSFGSGYHWWLMHFGPVFAEVAFLGIFTQFWRQTQNFCLHFQVRGATGRGREVHLPSLKWSPGLGKQNSANLKSPSYVHHETPDLLKGWRAPPSTIREISLKRINTHQYHHYIHLTTVAAKNMKHHYFNFTNLLIFQANVTNISQPRQSRWGSITNL